MTISDIAKMAGVSSAAVSRYLNGGPLSEQKRAVIHEVVEKTGYRPDTAAQTLRTGKVNQVGVIAPSIGSQSVGQITAGIASELDAKSYLLLLGNTELDAQRELGYLTAMQRMNGVGHTVFLHRTAEQIARRLSPYGRRKRPRLRGLDDAGLVAFMERDMAVREPFYAQAHLVVDCDAMSDDQVVEHILRQLGLK